MRMTETTRKRAPGGGRKPLAEGVTLKNINAKVLPEQHAKYMSLGGSDWLRKQIDDAPDGKDAKHDK